MIPPREFKLVSHPTPYRIPPMPTPSPRPFALLAAALTLLLAACGKVETPSSQSAPANVAPVVEKPATPNTFSEVTSQLDPGGDLYLYLSTAQFLGRLSHGIDAIHDMVLSGSAGMEITDRDEAGKIFALVKDIVQKSGLEQITGLGASSFATAPGLYRNKFFAHHYPDKGDGILWSIYGKAPHTLTGLDFLPADTAAGGVGDFDLAQLINFLRQEINTSNIPEAKEALDKWQTQFAGASGLPLDDVLASLNGSLGTILTLDATSTISVPVAGQTQVLPTPRLAFLIGVKSDLIFNQVDKMAGVNPGVVRIEEPGLHMRVMALPILPFLNLRLTVAQWNGFLIIASDDKLVRDMIAVHNGAPGFTSTSEYATLSAGLPDQGNSFGLCTQRFADTLRQFQSQLLSNQPGVNQSQAAFMHQLFSRYQKTGHMYAVGSQLPTGWLSISQGSQGSNQFLAPFAMLPAAIAPAVIAGIESKLSTGQ